MADVLVHAARVHGDSPAFAVDGALIGYAALRERVSQLAAQLAGAGLAPGDRVALLEENTAEFLELTFAAAWAGLVLVPLNTRLLDRDLAFVLADSGSRGLVVGLELLELGQRSARLAAVPCWLIERDRLSSPGQGELAAGEVSAEPVPVERESACQIYYTSGTTGQPKGVVLTHRNVTAHALCAIAELGLSPLDVWGHVAPMFHLADAWATIALTWVGARHVFLGRFEPRHALDLFEQQAVTISNLVPTMLNLMVLDPSLPGRRFPSLRRILSGGAPIAPKVVERVIQAFGAEYVQTYGMTETSPYLTMSLLSRDQLALPEAERLRLAARTGRAVLGVELELVDPAGRPVPRDDRSVGEIRVRGESVTPGYWRRPEATQAALGSGWLMTGDLATWDRRGSVQIVDRAKDMILSGGENVYSTEVEAVLYEHPAVLEAAAYGEPDPVWGERVCAAIVLRPGHGVEPEQLALFCRERLAGFKLPRQWRFLGSLPRTGSGKIAKRLLRETPGEQG